MLETGINEAKKISEDRMIKLLKFSLDVYKRQNYCRWSRNTCLWIVWINRRSCNFLKEGGKCEK